MYIIMLGAPGSGKGTIGAAVRNHFKLQNISTGEMFRSEIKNNTELGIKANEYISKGKLVPDDIAIKLAEDNLENLDNVLLDGFPRTVNQAKALKEFLAKQNKKVTVVINLNVPDEDIVKRTSSRIICSNKSCGVSYNTEFMPPKIEGICDKCGAKLIKRPDDNPETIKQRLIVYHKQTEPLLEFYKKEGILNVIDIDIYDKDTKEKTTSKTFEIIENNM